MRIFKSKLLPLCLLFSIPLFNLIYEALNNGQRGSRQLLTVIDAHIPFLQIFIIPYLLWYTFIFGLFIVFCIFDRPMYYRALFSCLLGMLVCYTIYFFFQTTVPRPQIHGNSLLLFAIKSVYGQDQPFNCFPSIHVLTSYIMILAIRNSRIRKPWHIRFVTIFAVLIILSTLFIKQHVVLDAAAGMLLGNITFKFFAFADFSAAIPSFKRWFKSKKANVNS